MSYQQPGYNPQYGQQQGGYPPQGGYGAAPPPGWNAMPPPNVPRAGYMAGNAHHAETGGYGGANDSSGPFKYNLQFSELSIRQAFIRKVFTLVAIMLGVVAVITALPYIIPDFGTWLKGQPGVRGASVGVYYASYAAFMVTYIALICCESVRRSSPMNIIVTAIFTIATGFMTMCLSAQFKTESVLLALIITTAACGSVIIFAMQTKYDITSCIGVAFGLSIFLMLFGLVAIIAGLVFRVQWIFTVYAGIGALIFMLFLAIDIQMLMGGRQLEMSPEDHIFAAVQIFIDIVQIFWFILSIFGSRD